MVRTISCSDGVQTIQVPLKGNKFSYDGLDFVISNDKVLTSSLEFKAIFNREQHCFFEK